jgi:hypothetical protein
LLSTTLVKFEESHGTFDEEWKTKSPLLPMTIINRFEKVMAPLEEGEEKTHCCQRNWINLFEKK